VECVLLPVPNTTTELLARWIGEQVRESLKAGAGPCGSELVVRLEENFGQWASCTLQLD
jgi:6-pyruvoyltetrahydropterin/6-carboxytetrahydropterin synthase